ncbi:hypothetical protein PMAYCL1PPCAC_13200, partial [Pristionchus mayeri]
LHLPSEMAESEKEKKLLMRDRFIEIARSPIGSLSLRKVLESNKRTLSLAFSLLCPSAASLALSPSGYPIIECFLNANEDSMNVGLSDSLSGDWNELEQVLKTVKGRHLCEILLDRKMKTFAHNLIAKVPREWWFKNVDSLPILVKAFSSSEIHVMKEFISNEQTETDLCNTEEGLYCVLKVREKLKDQLGCRSSFESLILRKAKSIEGSEALVQVILYGNLMTKEIIEIVCRRESFDDPPSVSLISRLIQSKSSNIRRLVFDCLSLPEGNPLIYQIRFSDLFDDFKEVCDTHFTLEQRQQLEECLAERTVESAVDECIHAAKTLYEQSTGVTVCDEGKSRKRKMEMTVEMQPRNSSGLSNEDDDLEISLEVIKKKPTLESTVVMESAIVQSQQADGSNQGESSSQIPSQSVNTPKAANATGEETQTTILGFFTEVDAAVDGTWTLKQSTRYTTNFMSRINVQRVETRQLFSALLKERISGWAMSVIGRNVLEVFANNRNFRPALTDTIPSVLCSLADVRGEKILGLMLSLLTRADFIHYCLLGGVSSPFASLFRSELPAEECVKIGMKLVQALPQNVHTFLTHTSVNRSRRMRREEYSL